MLTARIAVIASGGGTNLQALIDAQGRGELKSGSIALVIADKAGTGASQRAGKAGIPCAVIVRKEPEFEEKVLAALAEYNIDMVILAGFLGIFSGSFIQKFHRPIINIHPALIPSFCGKGFYGLRVHQAALDYGVKVTGATVHYASEVVDGGQIIAQKAVDVLPGDTPEILQRRVMEQAEWVLLPQAAELVSAQIVHEKESNI
ncbi:MAG: phosphoribosylglycinamide formyltransferase [Oscillospiraceae bacterium]|nr:phosphoribosylglycinamide formyltransferase [Oscillospiraceae bacterium]